MSHTTAQLGFPRRIVGLYLLFSVGALTLLAVGFVAMFQSHVRNQAIEYGLSQVDRLAAAVKMDRIASAGSGAQELVERALLEGRLVWCAVADAQGQFLAHTDHSLIGGAMLEPIGEPLVSGVVNGVGYRNENRQLIHEFRVPLEIGRKSVGSLVLAIVIPEGSQLLREFGANASFVIIAPFGVIAWGAWVLSRMTKPMSQVMQELSAVARLPMDETPGGRRIAAKSLSAIGWNRVVDSLAEYREVVASNDTTRLEQLVAAAGGGKTRAALECLSEGIAVTDAEGRVEFANRAIAALLCRDESLQGELLDDLLATVSPESAAMISAATPRAEVVTEVKLATHAGERMLRLSRAPLASDSTPGHVWSVRDITQQKLSEASRDQFIDTATHELRTPLANIKAYAETLAMGEILDIEDQKEFCNTINAEATRLARFVDDLLSISSLEVGSLGIQRTNVDVRRLLEEAADKVRPLLKQRSITFDVSLAEKLGEAHIDKDKVSGMVLNLLGNAAKYTPEGGAVTLAAVRQDGVLRIEVRDTGVGIAEEEAERVFEKFFRSGNPAIRDSVGSGLGLPLAREIARLHRGDITLDSKLGEGSNFTATLPVQ